MQMSLVVQQILGFAVAPDAKTVEIAVRSGPDTIKFVYPTPDLDGVIEILTEARDAAKAQGLPTDAQTQVRLPKSVAVGKDPNSIGAVLLFFDRALPTRTAFMIGHQAAREVGNKLMAAGCEARDAARIVQAAASEARQLPALNGVGVRRPVLRP